MASSLCVAAETQHLSKFEPPPLALARGRQQPATPSLLYPFPLLLPSHLLCPFPLTASHPLFGLDYLPKLWASCSLSDIFHLLFVI